MKIGENCFLRIKISWKYRDGNDKMKQFGEELQRGKIKYAVKNIIEFKYRTFIIKDKFWFIFIM